MTTSKKLEWQQEQAIIARVCQGPWSDWLASARKPKDLVLNEAEVKLASRLGLPFVPKGTGVLSFGWVVAKLIDGGSSHNIPQNDPLVQVLNRFGNEARRQIPGISQLVLNLMVHREAITNHSHNCFYYYQENGPRLYMDYWSPLDEDVLTWAMLHSPLADLSTADGDEWFTEVRVQNGRLHFTAGPAIRTSKNRTLYAINGVIMTHDEYMLRGDARAILKTQNVEVRRVLVEDLGAERFIQESGLKPLHSDETGMLYRLTDDRKEAWNVRHLCWVHVVCPSTQHEYMLAVPPTTRTAREGVAWTFRKLPEEYQPGQET